MTIDNPLFAINAARCPECGNTEGNSHDKSTYVRTCAKCGHAWQDGVPMPEPPGLPPIHPFPNQPPEPAVCPRPMPPEPGTKFRAVGTVGRSEFKELPILNIEGDVSGTVFTGTKGSLAQLPVGQIVLIEITV